MFSTNTFTQNYFPTANAIWNESVQDRNSYYGLLGDTIINNIPHSKLFQFSDTMLSVEKIQRYIGAIRNEEQKVFFKPMAPFGYYVGQEYIEEILLYDFGAKIGDTVWHNAIWYNYFDIFFDPDSYSIIESIQIDNNRKIYSVRGPVFFNQWYEGIGSGMGVLRSITTSPLYIPPSDYELNCFKHNDTVKYLNNPTCNKCFCTSNNVLENSFSDIMNIYPNPTEDVLNINISENAEIKSISMYSIDGKLIERYIHFYNSCQLNISHLKQGIYIIKIETIHNIFNKLLIKK